ncbi:MAG: pyruvate:ferredoxin (flavodoxin) oxidoreductase [Spirochaetaceae bacterium]|nr:MAG: pyruvate:ferredoxin (flavodoxin) oxidoreductase [Spirochaetaceae bacterium]
MSNNQIVTIDGNQAAAYVAHATNEVIAIYPITPSSGMGEISDQYSADGRRNVWGTIPDVVEMQSEAGAAGAVHGALTTGALTTTFTASQGLLLMIPNMFKIAGELTPTVFHIAARAVSNQALSIFGDHSDVMAARATGFAMMASNSPQEVMDFALISQAATLESRIPFLHFFDGFRTSHEVQKIEELSYEQMRAIFKPEAIHAHRARGLSSEHPAIRGTSQNPDVFFAARETVNRFYSATPGVVQDVMDRFAKLTGRAYQLFDYVGAPDAERVVIMMGSGAETMEETVDHLVGQGEKVGLIKVRLYRPFSKEHLLKAVPATVTAISVLDRTKEPGALGEPMYTDVCSAIGEIMASGEGGFKSYPRIVGGRYGLGSNEFTPGMCKAVLDNLKQKKPRNHFTVGINDDVTFTSLEWDRSFDTAGSDVHCAVFYGLGADGTVGANKNSIKIIGDETDNYAQGYFVYDSKKSGATTVSHLRFGKKPIKSTYLIERANFLACHKFSFVEKYDMLQKVLEGGTFLLASPYGQDEVWNHLPVEVQQQIIDKKLKFYVIDAIRIAEEMGMGSRINVIMQTAFFSISGVLPEDQAVELIKDSIRKTYGGKGQDIVDRNIATIDAALNAIQKVDYPSQTSGNLHMIPPVPANSPEFVKKVTGEIIAGRGHLLPVSLLPNDGTYPTGTTKYEKRNIAESIPVWDEAVCIQCGDCSAVCPHGTIRMKAYDAKFLDKAPKTFKSTDAKGKELSGLKFTIQVAPEDCTGCSACVVACPAFRKQNGEKTEFKAINMEPQPPLRAQEAENWDYFLSIPNTDTSLIKRNTTKGSQLLEPLFEFSGACAGCGETPYVKLMSQLFGDRMLIANATGCSSIYGGNLPTTPYTTRKDGRGPAWSNSLFEDAAEFGFGMRLTADKMETYARELLELMIQEPPKSVPASLLRKLADNPQTTPEDIEAARAMVDELKQLLDKDGSPAATELLSAADHLIRKSVWVLGGDGWAYDIGYGGLDHVMASGRNINVLVMDTEVYSNTGGQMSKATPIGAIAKFAAGGKSIRKKDLGMMLMTYGYVYVARIAMGYNRQQTIKAFLEAEAYDGPSIIIAYSHCIAHGIDMALGQEQQKAAVTSGLWPLFRYNPLLANEGKNPLALDSKEPSTKLADYMYKEIRYRSLKQAKPEVAQVLYEKAEKVVQDQWETYKYLADRPGRS